jgi:hypothetical protein
LKFDCPDESAASDVLDMVVGALASEEKQRDLHNQKAIAQLRVDLRGELSALDPSDPDYELCFQSIEWCSNEQIKDLKRLELHFGFIQHTLEEMLCLHAAHRVLSKAFIPEAHYEHEDWNVEGPVWVDGPKVVGRLHVFFSMMGDEGWDKLLGVEAREITKLVFPYLGASMKAQSTSPFDLIGPF